MRTEADELARAQVTVALLESALVTSRTVGVAIGIVVERLRLTAADAFAHLAAVSQAHGRTVDDVAAELVQTGSLPDARHGPARST